MFVLALLSLVSVALATGPCCPPKQWQGNAGLTMSIYNSTSDVGHFIEGGMKISIDADRGLVVSQQSIRYDNTSIQQTVINDYNTGAMYLLGSDGSCSASKIENTDIPFCIPDNATHNGRINFGFGDNTVVADSFTAQFDKYKMYIAVTSDMCVPLTEAFVGGDAGNSIMESLHYSGISLGIDDASIFDIPAICSRAVISPALPGLAGKRRSLFH